MISGFKTGGIQTSSMGKEIRTLSVRNSYWFLRWTIRSWFTKE